MNAPIIVGDTWVTRNKAIVEITGVELADPMPVKSGNLCWNLNGRYWDDDFDHSLDLLEKKILQ